METLNNLCEDAKTYVALKGDSIKLKLAKGLSISISSLLAGILIIAMAQLVLIALTVALVLLAGKLCGSYMVGALIATGIYLAVLIILIACRKKLFTGPLVRTFVKLFFPEDNEN